MKLFHSLTKESKTKNRKQKKETDQEFLKRLSDKIVERRLTTVAILYLETHKPLSFAFSQLMHVSVPFASLIVDPASIERMALILQDRDNVEKFICMIEESQREHDTKRAEKESKNGK